MKMGINPVPEKQRVNLQYVKWTKSIKLKSSNVIYHGQVPVEEYWFFFSKPSASSTIYYLRPYTIKIILLYIYCC